MKIKKEIANELLWEDVGYEIEGHTVVEKGD